MFLLAKKLPFFSLTEQPRSSSKKPSPEPPDTGMRQVFSGALLMQCQPCWLFLKNTDLPKRGQAKMHLVIHPLPRKLFRACTLPGNKGLCFQSTWSSPKMRTGQQQSTETRQGENSIRNNLNTGWGPILCGCKYAITWLGTGHVHLVSLCS